MTIIDHDKISDLIQECAQDIILPRFRQLSDHQIDTKTGPKDLVTEADILAERYLESRIPDIYAGSVIVGEEGISQGRHDLQHLALSGERMIWVIDPVDGTFNFVEGTEHFGVMVACLYKDEVQHSWIYHPVQGIMYQAEKGAGAYKDTQRLSTEDRVKNVNKIPDIEGFISRRYFPETIAGEIGDRMTDFKSWQTIGAAAHEYTRIAEGQADLALYSRLNPWDHLPGSLIVEEAGGHIRKWDKNRYSLHDLQAGLIVTTSEDNWRMLHLHIFSGIDISPFI